jgi:lipopolysaccharide/colanic/teichoic acid biosynthesis glycosyltransferase
MKNILKFFALFLLGCIGLGFIISKLEKTRGWVEGHKPKGIYEKHIKRPLDFGLALFALIVSWPLLLLTAIAVRINMGSPVMFAQERPGLDEKIFKIYKFRTMTDNRDDEGNLLPDNQRMTRFGRWLRASSCDELGELWNIVRGDLAIIGPRPLLVEYLPRYSEEQKHRHDVRPGLTSLSASKKRNLATWDSKFEDDVKYVNDITFLGDVKILINTVKIVIKREGIHSNTSETMEAFTGNEEK